MPCTYDERGVNGDFYTSTEVALALSASSVKSEAHSRHEAAFSAFGYNKKSTRLRKVKDERTGPAPFGLVGAL